MVPRQHHHRPNFNCGTMGTINWLWSHPEHKALGQSVQRRCRTSSQGRRKSCASLGSTAKLICPTAQTHPKPQNYFYTRAKADESDHVVCGSQLRVKVLFYGGAMQSKELLSPSTQFFLFPFLGDTSLQTPGQPVAGAWRSDPPRCSSSHFQ